MDRSAQTLRPPCRERARARPRPPSTHPNSADPPRQPGTPRAGTRGPSRTWGAWPQPVFPASLQPRPCSGVLAPRSGPAGSRSQRAGSGPAPRRLRSPCLGRRRGAMSVRGGWSSDLNSRALSSAASPGSEKQPHSRRGFAEENNATARSSGPGPSRPARLAVGPASGPASGSPQPIRLSQTGKTPPSQRLSANSPRGGGAPGAPPTERPGREAEVETKARREERSAGSPFPETRAEEGSHALTWGGPGKGDQLEGERQETRGLAWARLSGRTRPILLPSLSPPALAALLPGDSPASPPPTAPNSLCPLSTLCFHPLVLRMCLLGFILTPIGEA